jgi:hypothetical protein
VSVRVLDCHIMDLLMSCLFALLIILPSMRRYVEWQRAGALDAAHLPRGRLAQQHARTLWPSGAPIAHAVFRQAALGAAAAARVHPGLRLGAALLAQPRAAPPPAARAPRR